MRSPVKSPSIRPALVMAALTAGVLAGFSGHSQAAGDLPAKTGEVRTLDLRSWTLDPSTGWSVRKLIGKKVKGPKSETLLPYAYRK